MQSKLSNLTILISTIGLLLLLVSPATAAVGSSVDDYNLNPPQNTTNMTINNKGNVELGVYVNDGFEDNGLKEWEAYGTDTEGWSTSTVNYSGNYGGKFYDTDGGSRYEFLSRGNHSITKNITVEGWVRGSSVDNWLGLAAGSDGTSDGVTTWIRPSTNDIRIRDDSGNSYTDNSGSMSTGTWYYLAIEYDPINGVASAYIDNDEDYTNNPINSLTGKSVRSADSSHDKWGLSLYDQNRESLYWDNISKSRVPDSGSIKGPGHDLADSTGGWFNVSGQNFYLNITVRDNSTGTTLTTKTLSSTGNHSLTWDGKGTSGVYYDVSVYGDNFTLYDEGVEFNSTSSTSTTVTADTQSTDASLFVTETISTTMTNVPVEFGDIAPGNNDKAATSGAVDLIVENQTNIDVDMAMKATDFSGPDPLESNNMTYAAVDNKSQALTVTNGYIEHPFTEWQNLTERDTDYNRNAYFWMNVPETVESGDYSSTVSFKVHDATTAP